MIICYDLSCNPPTYDFCTFLGKAELLRQHHNQEHIDIYVLAGPDNGFRKDNLWPHGTEKRLYLRDNVVAPMAKLLPSVRGLHYVPYREVKDYKLELGYKKRFISLREFLAVYRAGFRPLRFPGLIEKKRKFITITLREAEHYPLRNSNTSAWLSAAKIMQDAKYDVVIIRDTEKATDKIDGFEFSPMASINLIRRAQLYSQAEINFGINNGPMWMALLMDVPVIMLKPTCNAMGGCYDDQFFKQCGLAPNTQLPNAPAYQKIVWKEDTMDNIILALSEHAQCQIG